MIKNHLLSKSSESITKSGEYMDLLMYVPTKNMIDNYIIVYFRELLQTQELPIYHKSDDSVKVNLVFTITSFFRTIIVYIYAYVIIFEASEVF